jgi:PiT family inorganic phosphate transporter
MSLFLVVLLAALVFEYINGFHDAANAIATVVSTKVLTARQAILMAAACDLLGAFLGTAVATTIGNGLVDAQLVVMPTVLSALVAAIVWGLFTWWLGLPSSSSHALVGGLCGAALATAHGNWGVLRWSVVDDTGKPAGLWHKVVLPMVSSPLFGFAIGGVFMLCVLVCIRRMSPKWVRSIFGRAQLASAAFMGISHGSNDA